MRRPSTQRHTPMIQVTDSIVLNDREVKERFVRATGARGQNVNKEATAVELRVDIERTSLPSDVKKRLMTLAGRHVTTGGVLVVVSRRSVLRRRIVRLRAPGPSRQRYAKGEARAGRA